jgi:hypothetical protein
MIHISAEIKDDKAEMINKRYKILYRKEVVL